MGVKMTVTVEAGALGRLPTTWTYTAGASGDNPIHIPGLMRRALLTCAEAIEKVAVAQYGDSTSSVPPLPTLAEASTTTETRFAALQKWSSSWWSESGPSCSCGQAGHGVRHHEIGCPFFAWAWEMKARDLLRGGAPDADPATHLRGATGT